MADLKFIGEEPDWEKQQIMERLEAAEK